MPSYLSMPISRYNRSLHCACRVQTFIALSLVHMVSSCCRTCQMPWMTLLLPKAWVSQTSKAEIGQSSRPPP